MIELGPNPSNKRGLTTAPERDGEVDGGSGGGSPGTSPNESRAS